MSHQQRRKRRPEREPEAARRIPARRAFKNYMLPFEIDGRRVFLLGVRDTPAEPFPLSAPAGREATAWTDSLSLRAALAKSGVAARGRAPLCRWCDRAAAP